MVTAYWFCVALGTAWTLASLALGHFGADHGHDAGHDTGHDGGGEVSFPLFSPTVMATFVASFGGIGLIGSTMFGAERTALHLPVALGGATALALGVATLLFKVTQAVESDSTVNVSELRGSSAEVITAIPESGLGEVAYVASGIRYTAPARALDGGKVAVGTLVEIDRIEGATAYVRAPSALPEPSGVAVKS